VGEDLVDVVASQVAARQSHRLLLGAPTSQRAGHDREDEGLGARAQDG
jgi:hypothetical protein